MAGLSTTLTKNFKAEAAVPRRRIVKFGAAAGVIVGAASTDKVFGISSEIDAAIGEPCDVHLGGLPEVEYGGVVGFGDYLTSDGVGRAVAAAPGAGVNASIIGQAMVSGVLGDVGVCLMSPGRIQG
ncbi:MAG: DUF2190 family protein [Sphingomonadales bacterium]|nr:DUF2190 family protein [Sphingomonadales bacterium]